MTTYSTESITPANTSAMEIDRTASYLEIMSENSQQEAMQIEDMKL